MPENAIVYRNEDSYCGPISMLVKLPDEEVLLIFREAKWRGRTTHSDPTTRTCLIRSRDRGQTWFSQVTPDPGGGNGTAMVRLSDGTILANAFHWVFVPPEERETLAGMPRQTDVEWVNMVVAGGGVFMTRSRTDGYTWEPPVHIPEPEGWTEMACHGAALELPDGDLLLPVTVRGSEDGQDQGLVLRSKDKGHTWGDGVCITDDGPADTSFHETRLLLCPSGRLLAMHRTPKANYFQNVSTDGGRTWSDTKDSGLWCGASSPPDLKLLADGRLLLTRGYRRGPFGVRCHVSADEGDTWAQEVVLRDDGPDRDVGYPSTVQFSDGQLLTVYYWHGEDGIRHLQRTSWELEG